MSLKPHVVVAVGKSIFLFRYVAAVGGNPSITPYPAVLILPKSFTPINPQQLETRASYMN